MRTRGREPPDRGQRVHEAETQVIAGGPHLASEALLETPPTPTWPSCDSPHIFADRAPLSLSPPVRLFLNPYIISPRLYTVSSSKDVHKTEKMVAGFRRSLSLPKPVSSSDAPEKSYHVRSTSLPNRCHPSVFQIREQLQSLKAWENRTDKGTAAWLCAGLNQIKHLHDSLDDLLQLDQFQAPLRRRGPLAETLLDHSLRFVDAYGILRAALVGLKEEQLAAQVAIRRRDAAVVAACVKAQRKIQREVLKAAAVVREIGKLQTRVGIADVDAEVAGIVRDVNAATAVVSVAALCGVAAPSAKALTTALKSWVGLKRKQEVECGLVREFEEAGGENLRSWREDEKMALRRLEALEEATVGIERECERVFRSLISTRVSLLNVLTQ